MTEHLARISAVNPTINALGEVWADTALKAAEYVDRRRARGEQLGELAGVPLSVKANIHVQGRATTHGIPRFAGMIAAEDAPGVARLRAAGAIPVGHSNMPDLALSGMHPRSQLYGDTINPWDAGRTPGGSSGGDAAAVATGMVDLALGNDSGGSVRIPAAFCGVAALKPSYGRFAADHRLGGQEPTLSSQLFPVDGPMARSVGELRAAYEVLAGADVRDPRTVSVPLYGPPSVGPVRVGVVVNPGGLGVHPHVRAAVAAATDALTDAGYLVQEVELPGIEDALAVYRTLVMTEFAAKWPAIKSLLAPGGERYIELSMQRHPPTDLAGYLEATATRFGIQRSWAQMLAATPLILAPVFTEPPVAPGLESTGPEGWERVANAHSLCTATSLVGVPAVAVPTGLVDGLPSGVQVIGQMYREDLCLKAAEAIERRLGVLTPIPPGTTNISFVP